VGSSVGLTIAPMVVPFDWVKLRQDVEYDYPAMEVKGFVVVVVTAEWRSSMVVLVAVNGVSVKNHEIGPIDVHWVIET
jgi:hypothetical protein